MFFSAEAMGFEDPGGSTQVSCLEHSYLGPVSTVVSLLVRRLVYFSNIPSSFQHFWKFFNP
jgi:hypothetical protein